MEIWPFQDNKPARAAVSKVIKQESNLTKQLTANKYSAYARGAPNRYCVVGMFRNESKIIERMLQSLVDSMPIDEYCITDTGSTDNTKQLIRDFFAARGIPGELHDLNIAYTQKTFDFGTARSLTLRRAWGKCDWLVLTDGDYVWKSTQEWWKQDLKAMCDVIHIEEGDGHTILHNGKDERNLSNPRPHLVRSHLPSRYEMPTHEFLAPNGGGIWWLPREKWPKIFLQYEHYHVRIHELNTLKISHIGDGGSKASKFERDEYLLRTFLKRENPSPPNNLRSRALFYLSETLRNSGIAAKQHESFVVHRQHADMPESWNQEKIWSMIHTANAYKHLNRPRCDVLNQLAMCISSEPHRKEPYAEFIQMTSDDYTHAMAGVLTLPAAHIPYTYHILFIMREPYYSGNTELKWAVGLHYLPYYRHMGEHLIRRALKSKTTYDQIKNPLKNFLKHYVDARAIRDQLQQPIVSDDRSKLHEFTQSIMINWHNRQEQDVLCRLNVMIPFLIPMPSPTQNWHDTYAVYNSFYCVPAETSYDDVQTLLKCKVHHAKYMHFITSLLKRDDACQREQASMRWEALLHFDRMVQIRRFCNPHQPMKYIPYYCEMIKLMRLQSDPYFTPADQMIPASWIQDAVRIVLQTSERFALQGVASAMLKMVLS